MNQSISTTVVSYWAGTLPEITKLHFLSFEYQNDLNFKYVLYTDVRADLKSSIPEDLSWLLEKPWFENKNVDLIKLMKKYKIAPFSPWKMNFKYKLIRRFKNNVTFNFLKCTRDLNFRHLRKYRDLHLNSEVGFSLCHAQKFSGLSEHLTYRADVFRSLIANELPNENVLYVDLDICFMKRFSEYTWSEPFTSPWGLAKFANTAIIFFPAGLQSMRNKIVNELISTAAAWPWILYSEHRCIEYGLKLRPIEEFDQPWALNNPVSADSRAFMQRRNDLEDIISWVDKHSFCFHWHNQWASKPENGSPYSYYLDKFKK